MTLTKQLRPGHLKASGAELFAAVLKYRKATAPTSINYMEAGAGLHGGLPTQGSYQGCVLGCCQLRTNRRFGGALFGSSSSTTHRSCISRLRGASALLYSGRALHYRLVKGTGIDARLGGAGGPLVDGTNYGARLGGVGGGWGALVEGSGVGRTSRGYGGLVHGAAALWHGGRELGLSGSGSKE